MSDITPIKIANDWCAPFSGDAKVYVKGVAINIFAFWIRDSFTDALTTLNYLNDNYDTTEYDPKQAPKYSYTTVIDHNNFISRMPHKYKEKYKAVVYELYCFCKCGAHTNISHIIFALRQLMEVINNDRQEPVNE